MLNMSALAAQVCGVKPRFEKTSCSQCGRDTGLGDAGHSSCATHVLDHINALASVNCVDDISRREKLASIQMLASEAIDHCATHGQQVAPVNKLAITAADTNGLYHYDYTGSEGLELACYLEYEAAERQTNDCPGHPEGINLIYALHKGEDISEVISDDTKGLIEEEALHSMEMDKWNVEYDRGEDRYHDMREAA